MAASPPLEIAALSSKKLEVLSAPDLDQSKATGTAGTSFQYSKAGDRYVKCNDTEVTICDADGSNSPVLFSVDSPVTLLHFSPTGRYLVTHCRLPKEGYLKNLQVWDTEDGTMVAAFHKKGVNADNWPAVQFNAEETHLFLLVKSAIAVYDMASDLTQESHKVKMENCSQYAVCPAPGKKVLATFVPECKGNMPAVVACSEWSKGGGVTNRKQFFRAQRTSLKWNSKGTHFLGHTSCDFDSTNQSYFGESRLYLLTSDDRIDMQVTMEGEAMVSDCAWSPDGQFFVALGGISPSTAVLFDTKGKPVYQLGTGPYNQVCWNPQSRFILLAGFGNMPGDIRLFEKKADNACKPMGGCRSECSVMVEWSPCGRFFMTASVAPRMRVDNRVTVFTYYGTQVANKPFEELRSAYWRPRPAGSYPDRGQSPERLKAVAEGKKQGKNLTVAPKAAGYVPPHLRGANGERTQKQVEGFDADEAAGRVRSMMAKRTKQVEGVESIVPNKNANKNARKRANKAKKQAEGKSEGDANDVGAAASGVQALQVEEPPAPAADAAPQDPAKRLRNLRKKLTKVEAAKAKQAKGETLSLEQIESVNGEAALRDEMRSLGAMDV